MGIYSISGLPSNLTYEISDYKLHDKICDSTGGCSLGITKLITLTVKYKDGGFNSSSTEYNLKLDFDFRKMHTVTYEGMTNNNYPTTVIDGGNLNVSFITDIPENLVIYNDGIKVDSSKYSYVNNTLTFNNVSGGLVIKSAKNLFNIIKLKTNGVDTNIDFAVASSETNGDGVNTVSGTESNEYPVYYYRGNVTDNNVKFANFCWKMVRTTDTGGVKLIYNGVPGNDGYCNNTGTASQIGTSAFNSIYRSPAYVGYMYGTVYTATEKDMTDQTETYIYGNDVSWDGTNYTLTGDTMTSSSWATDYKTLATKYHYTCFNDIGTCDNVYYINFFGHDDAVYYLTLKDGEDIEIAKNKMFTNITDSTIKLKIDNWFESNVNQFKDDLEDTIWCNDRELARGILYNKDSSGSTNFAAYVRRLKPSIICSNIRDRFTVDSSDGNRKLTYPVGLLTSDEYTLAGSGTAGYSTSAYLHTEQQQWTLSPTGYHSYYGNVLAIDVTGNLNVNYSINHDFGVRPAVSLKVGTLITSGDGSVINPYVVE